MIHFIINLSVTTNSCVARYEYNKLEDCSRSNKHNKINDGSYFELFTPSDTTTTRMKIQTYMILGPVLKFAAHRPFPHTLCHESLATKVVKKYEKY